ncbi:MAG: hypothetical protein KDB86_00150 [Actinobacteria bacterium]|nr:hypothetical protein [Actinomycetota bacterium]MCB9388366.1 hypothetical protein [Acidimicrobiia bacterium]
MNDFDAAERGEEAAEATGSGSGPGSGPGAHGASDSDRMLLQGRIVVLVSPCDVEGAQVAFIGQHPGGEVTHEIVTVDADANFEFDVPVGPYTSALVFSDMVGGKPTELDLQDGALASDEVVLFMNILPAHIRFMGA